MPRPPVDLARKIKDILLHVQPLPDDAQAPILHYRRTGAEIWGSLAYIERAVNETAKEKVLTGMGSVAWASIVAEARDWRLKVASAVGARKKRK